VHGYEAPPDTVAPAARTTLAFVRIVADAHRAGVPWPVAEVNVPPALHRDFAAIREAVGVDLPDHVIVSTIAAWSQLFGLVGLELNGQTRNVIHHHAALFDATLAEMVVLIGLLGR